jgi:hypothetical protein
VGALCRGLAKHVANGQKVIHLSRSGTCRVWTLSSKLVRRSVSRGTGAVNRGSGPWDSRAWEQRAYILSIVVNALHHGAPSPHTRINSALGQDEASGPGLICRQDDDYSDSRHPRDLPPEGSDHCQKSTANANAIHLKEVRRDHPAYTLQA